jgi:hypothetical protein
VKLEELQTMTREQLETVFSQRKQSWVRKGRKIDRTALIRALIYAIRDHYQNSAEARVEAVLEDKRGCREVWYNVVKAVVLKADPDWVNNAEKGRKGGPADIFEKILADEVDKTKLTYSDLGILDYRTMRRICEEIVHASCWRNVILFVEKDSAAIHLIPLAEFLNITLISGGGWSHKAGVEAALNELKARRITEVIVLGLTDYDNYGDAIFEQFLALCERKYGFRIKEHRQIGVFPEHVSAERIEISRYPLKRNSKCSVLGLHNQKKQFDAEEWLQEKGLPDESGEKRFGLEIEAVSGQDNGHQILREIVVTEILKVIDEEDRIHEITAQVWKKAPLEAIKDIFYAIDRQAQLTDEEILTPHRLPTKFLTYVQLTNEWSIVEAERKEELGDLDETIRERTEALERLKAEKEERELPYENRKRNLAENYWHSRSLMAQTLYKWYQKNKDQFPRKNYALGYPSGCLLEAVKKQWSLDQFLKALENPDIDKDIKDVLISNFRERLADGTISKTVSNILKEQR